MKQPLQFSAFRSSLRLLTTRRFGTFWSASLLSSIGTWAQQVAEPWLLVTLGASPFLIGLDSFAADAPVWLLTLAGGALADRADRRRIIAGFQSVQMLCPTAILVLLLTHRVHPWMIVALSLVVGVTDALSMPSFQSIVPTIVSHDEIGAALTLNATQFNLSRILGPSIAGLLIAGVGMAACFAVNAASYVPFIGVALWILPRRAAAAARDETASPRHLLAGVRVVMRQPHVRDAIVTVFVTGLFCSPLITFAPVLIQSTFQGSAAQFSAAVGAFGIGGLLGAAGLLGVSPGTDRRRISIAFACAYGLVVAITAASPRLWALPVLLAAAGASVTISNTAANSLVQASTSPQLLGRTASVYMLAMRGGASLGSLVTGATVTWIGVRHALLANGLLAIAAQAALGSVWLRAAQPSRSAPG